MDKKSRFDNRPQESGASVGWLTTSEVMAALNVKRATVYTYVSRGWLTAIEVPGERAKRYSAADVRILSQRAKARSGHAPVASAAMRWGEPIVETRISTVRDGTLVYRGLPLADVLAEGYCFEQICDWLWGDDDASAPKASTWSIPRGSEAHRVAADGDELRRGQTRFIGRWIASLQRMAEDAGAGAFSTARSHSVTLAREVITTLAAGIPNHPKVDAALICCADHELNASAFAARVASATGADLYHCLIAALATFSGPKHGSASLRVEAFADEVMRGPDATTVVADRLQRGDPIPGLGHPLYPGGDPRARWLLDAADATEHPKVQALKAALAACAEFGCPAPNLDMGLTALAFSLGMPPGSAQLLFATGRLAGWCAHIMEQRETPGLLRPRARYVGR